MRVFVRTCARILGIALLLSLGIFVPAQGQEHVVTLGDLKNDQAARFAARQSNEAALRSLLRTEAAQKALQLSGLDYQKVDRAVGQLDDQELQKLSERARQGQHDFAAGRISDRDLLWIIVIILAVIVIAIAVH
jgi:hypothetical protein